MYDHREVPQGRGARPDTRAASDTTSASHAVELSALRRHIVCAWHGRFGHCEHLNIDCASVYRALED